MSLIAQLRTILRDFKAPRGFCRVPFFLGMVLMLAAGLAACAGGSGSGSGTGSGGGNTRIASHPERMDREEIDYWAERGAQDLAQLVSLARPRWLRAPSGQRSIYGNADASIVVFRDQRYLGGLEELRNLPLDGIVELRWLNASEADALPGPGSFHAHGGIMILTTASVRP